MNFLNFSKHIKKQVHLSNSTGSLNSGRNSENRGISYYPGALSLHALIKMKVPSVCVCVGGKAEVQMNSGENSKKSKREEKTQAHTRHGTGERVPGT